jgi:hypothetical protein
MGLGARKFVLDLGLANKRVNVYYKLNQYKESFMLRKNKIGGVIAFGVAALMLLTPNVFGVYYWNDVDLIFIIDDLENGLSKPASDSHTLKTRIVRGAGFFLKSYANFLDFLNQMELADLDGIDLIRLRLGLNQVIENMESAKQEYILFKQQADFTPYNPVILDILATFDYNAFQERHQVIQSIFNRVAVYLGNGNVRELFDYALLQNEDILRRVYFAKTLLECDTLPDAQYLKDLNQAFVQSLLFGQYTATIFGEIKQ